MSSPTARLGGCGGFAGFTAFVVRRGWWRPVNLRALWRYAVARVRWRRVEFEGFCFLGRHVRFQVGPQGRIVIGAWTHVNDFAKVRSHSGTVRVGRKVVLGHDLTLNSWLDVEIGDATIIGDRVYVCDFDHVTENPDVPIKDQGLVHGPVRIGADCWLGSGVTVTRNTDLGQGCVVAANAVVRGAFAPEQVLGGVPARVLADRRERWLADAEKRRFTEALGREAAEQVERRRHGEL